MVNTNRGCRLSIPRKVLFPLLAGTIVAILSCTGEPGSSSTELTVVPSITPVPTVPKDVQGCAVGPDAECPGASFDGQDFSAIPSVQGGGSRGREAADFSGSTLEGASFVGSNLEGVFFEGANLRGVDFKDANLRGVDFKDANLRGASFYQADLSGSDLTGADLENADLDDAILEGVIYCRTKTPEGSISDRDCP